MPCRIGLVHGIAYGAFRAVRGLAASFGKERVDAFKDIAAEVPLDLREGFFNGFYCQAVSRDDIDIRIYKKNGGIEQVKEFPDIEPVTFEDSQIAGCADPVADRVFL